MSHSAKSMVELLNLSNQGVYVKDRYVIFDRDGTLIDYVHHLVDPNLVAYKNDLIVALTKLQERGFKFGIITNQSVIGRGLASLETVNEINRQILDYLRIHNIEMQFVLLCPHLEQIGCQCRKPNPGLGHVAEKSFGVMLPKSYVVGDQESDLRFGKNLNCKVVQVHTELQISPLADFFSGTLTGAADWIIQDSKREEV
jgi:D-glycero-D-manno-heptose 1,7-bisphosphate phosphatase